MPVKAEFEEKSYETVMNAELGTGRNLFAFGQALERWIGYDASIFIDDDHLFWRLINEPFRTGSYDRVAREILRRRGINVRNVSCCNAFIQYKRPELLKHGSGRQKHFWRGSPFYRFDLLDHQHRVLLFQERCLTNAVVVYASPKFHLFNDLMTHINASNCVENSFFVKPVDLGPNSKAVTYSTSTFDNRYAHFSEPGEGEGVNILELINNSLRQNMERFESAKIEHLIDEWYNILPTIVEQFMVDDMYSKLQDRYSYIPEELYVLKKYLIGRAFSLSFGIDWTLVVGGIE